MKAPENNILKKLEVYSIHWTFKTHRVHQVPNSAHLILKGKIYQ